MSSFRYDLIHSFRSYEINFISEFQLKSAKHKDGLHPFIIYINLTCVFRLEERIVFTCNYQNIFITMTLDDSMIII